MDILDKDKADGVKLKESILTLIKTAQVGRSEVVCFSRDQSASVSIKEMPEELLVAPVIVKKVGCIVDYACIGILTPAGDLTLDDILSQLAASS